MAPERNADGELLPDLDTEMDDEERLEEEGEEEDDGGRDSKMIAALSRVINANEPRAEANWDDRLTKMQEIFTKQINERAGAQDAKWEKRTRQLETQCEALSADRSSAVCGFVRGSQHSGQGQWQGARPWPWRISSWPIHAMRRA